MHSFQIPSCLARTDLSRKKAGSENVMAGYTFGAGQKGTVIHAAVYSYGALWAVFCITFYFFYFFWQQGAALQHSLAHQSRNVEKWKSEKNSK